MAAIDRRHYFDLRQVIEGNDGRGIDVDGSLAAAWVQMDEAGVVRA